MIPPALRNFVGVVQQPRPNASWGYGCKVNAKVPTEPHLNRVILDEIPKNGFRMRPLKEVNEFREIKIDPYMQAPRIKLHKNQSKPRCVLVHQFE